MVARVFFLSVFGWHQFPQGTSIAGFLPYGLPGVETGDRVPENAFFLPRRSHRPPVTPVFQDASLQLQYFEDFFKFSCDDCLLLGARSLASAPERRGSIDGGAATLTSINPILSSGLSGAVTAVTSRVHFRLRRPRDDAGGKRSYPQNRPLQRRDGGGEAAQFTIVSRRRDP